MIVSRARSITLIISLVVVAIDTGRLPGHENQLAVAWSLVYFVIAASFVTYYLMLDMRALTFFYASLSVASGVRAVLLGAVDARWAGAALNVMIIIFLRDFVRARRIELL